MQDITLNTAVQTRAEHHRVCVWGGWWGGARAVWELPVPSAQLCCEPETALKNKVYLHN